MGVLHQKEQLPLGLRVQEQRAGADISCVGDLLRGDLIDAMLGEQLARRRGDALELGLLLPLASPERRCRH
ncbi:hypothetical protein D3C87_2072850 [compost metagenome]